MPNSAVCSRINDSPVCSDGGDGSPNPAADEAQLGQGVGGIHVEGVARRLTHIQGAAHVGGEHHCLQVVAILPRNLDDGLALEQLNLIGLAVSVPNNGGPREAVAELEAGERRGDRRMWVRVRVNSNISGVLYSECYNTFDKNL